LDNIPDRIDSKFRFVLLAAARAEQMIRGAAPKVENRKRRVTRLAMDEIRKDLVEWDYGPAPESEPLEIEDGTPEGEETAPKGS
jgi:DNA-directed RNA polymerase omega subunit